ERDDESHESHEATEARGSQILYWLDDLGAKTLAEARPENDGFLFAGARSIDDYARLVDRLPLLRDRPEERAPLLRLDTILDALDAACVIVPESTSPASGHSRWSPTRTQSAGVPWTAKWPPRASTRRGVSVVAAWLTP